MQRGSEGVLAALDADSDGEISHAEWMAAVGFSNARRLRESPGRSRSSDIESRMISGDL